MKQSADSSQQFLNNAQRSDWAHRLYAQAMDRFPVDASNDALVLAQALAARMEAICLNNPITSSSTDLVDSCTTCMWLISALLKAWHSDPFDTSKEVKTLAMALCACAGLDCALPYLQAIEALRPRML